MTTKQKGASGVGRTRSLRDLRQCVTHQVVVRRPVGFRPRKAPVGGIYLISSLALLASTTSAGPPCLCLRERLERRTQKRRNVRLLQRCPPRLSHFLR